MNKDLGESVNVHFYTISEKGYAGNIFKIMYDIVFIGIKLSSRFNIKDEIPFQEKHDLVHRSVFATENFNQGYIIKCAIR